MGNSGSLNQNATATSKIVVTGGCGFAGHHFVEHLIKATNWNIVVLDKLTYASNGFDRLRDVNCFDEKRVTVLTTDFSQEIPVGVIKEIGDVDYVVHMGAETHVDRSIQDPKPFVMSNVLGTMYMLDFARQIKNLKKFVYFSTDEVFGPATEGYNFKEWDRYNCTNPYAASKAGGEQLAMSYANCYQLPVIITNTMNIFGERQHPEKFIPLAINKIVRGETVLIHANKDRTRAGSRFWIHARNVASAILFLLDKGEFRERYNIVGEKEVDNLTLATMIASIIGKSLKYEMIDFHSSRPGHDLRYGLDGSKMKKMGWQIPMEFERSLESTIHWTLNHPKWL